MVFLSAIAVALVSLPVFLGFLIIIAGLLAAIAGSAALLGYKTMILFEEDFGSAVPPLPKLKYAFYRSTHSKAWGWHNQHPTAV